MAVDCAGNIYMAVHGENRIEVLTPTGDALATINVQPPQGVMDSRPTNVAFGGPDRKTLYITAVYTIWEVPLEIAGYPY
jgi:gluconolactonase